MVKSGKRRKEEVASGSGSGSAASSRCTSPTGSSSSSKEIVGTYELSSLPAAWDNSQEIRNRIREGLNLVVRMSLEEKPENGYVEGSTKNMQLNSEALLPVCHLMEQNSLKLPAIDNLIQAIDTFYRTAKMYKSLEQAYQEAWGIRRMIQKLKSYLYRTHPPQAGLDMCGPKAAHYVHGIGSGH